MTDLEINKANELKYIRNTEMTTALTEHAKSILRAIADGKEIQDSRFKRLRRYRVWRLHN